MKNMFSVTTVLPRNLLQTNPWIRHNFSTQVFTAYTSTGVRTLAGRGRFFSITEPLVSHCWKSLQSVCLQGVHLVPKFARERLWVELHSLFLHKTILHLLIYSQPPVVRHFTNWWYLSHFPWTTKFTRTFATSILWCYNFNGMIKWYDISCATLYIYTSACIVKNKHFPCLSRCTWSSSWHFKTSKYLCIYFMGP